MSGMEPGKTYKADFEVLETIQAIQNDRDTLLEYARVMERRYMAALEAIGPHWRDNHPPVIDLRREMGVEEILRGDK